MTIPRTARPCVSVPADLLAAYQRAGRLVPPLSTLLQQAMRAELARVGIPAELHPPPPPPDRLTPARARRWPR